MKNNIKNRVSEIITNIRLARERLNYTQDYLAMRMNVSQNAYSKIELGYSKLTLARLMEICNILEIPLSDMIEPEKKQVNYRLVYNPALQAQAV
ncbi:helix-turn-helix transcriptional regulator [Mucilaginibacter achroorhodeus]|uniref:Helix-turn-helix transcriptional regulator n=1 Tax=Mucilaginibacter achroorhodeus TaxID=2599294 RepID=A0A563U9P9_9SPHI|nr:MULTISPECIES: helix-turn-helix transcriptional regulator [Mucilaginibacter]QXV66946.1 helix-turn-helix transcriptional regulator [Mucilaginibacter sp. 21P]TWR28075.1 helix-turn-helix transcriptional regulator [Mucilaginibacter achroorhodeus]